MHKLLFGVTKNIDMFPLLCRNECAYSHFSMPALVWFLYIKDAKNMVHLQRGDET